MYSYRFSVYCRDVSPATRCHLNQGFFHENNWDDEYEDDFDDFDDESDYLNDEEDWEEEEFEDNDWGDPEWNEEDRN